jgi:hypothetical protein
VMQKKTARNEQPGRSKPEFHNFPRCT